MPDGAKVLRIIHVQAPPVDLRAVVLAGEAGDANLTACLLYLLVASDGGAPVEVPKLSKAFNVSDFTVTRWFRRLSKLGILVVRVTGDGILAAEIKLKRGLGAVENPEKHGLGGSGEHIEDAVVYAAGTNGNGMSLTQQARLLIAKNTLENCPTLTERAMNHHGSTHEVKMCLEKIVRNALFDSIDIPAELMNADAWVLRKSYKDMPKFLVNWFRKEAKKKKPLKNVNAAPSGKYEKLQAAARGA